MLTIVVVGRNDNHGYNLSKRVSSSLNSMAQMLLTGDEIIFVDWNTPIGYPSMPFSIQDDLLPKTKSLLRIVRVPERVHKSVSAGSNRELIEPIARNVGIRRASKSTQWILSTNTDILFASPSGKNFQEILVDLEERLWLSYRFELPEFVWDRLDRRNPEAASDFILKCYNGTSTLNRIRVDEGVSAHFPIPDGVGDFQLAPIDLWKLSSGFPEDMKKGWHVDTRLTLQMARVHSRPPSLLQESDLVIFHQNHLRNSTSYHSSIEMNSQEVIKSQYKNLDTWGLNDYSLEELTLPDEQELCFISTVAISETSSIEDTLTSSLEVLSKRLDYNLKRVLFFLTDEISILPQGSIVHCYSGNSKTKLALEKLCLEYGVTIQFEDFESIRVKAGLNCQARVSLLILDFGIESSSPIYSPFHGGESSDIVTEAGLIAIKMEEIAKLYSNPYMRVAIVRAGNWATREFARSFFDIPLFNNYTSLLCGKVKDRPRMSMRRRLILIGGICSDYGLDAHKYRVGYNPPRIFLLLKFNDCIARSLKALPMKFQLPIKKLLKKAIDL